MGRIICVANQKGGVGKTTTAINTAAALSLAGRSTLLIDLDPQANASSGSGVAAKDGDITAYEVVIGEKAARDGAQHSPVKGMDVIPSSRDLVGAEIELVQLIAREHRLAEALRPVRQIYDYVIIDCPPTLGLLTINGLTAADSVLVPLQCEYYALEGLSALLDTVDLVRKSLNPNLRIEGILLTMFDTRNSLTHQVAAEVRQHFPDKVFGVEIPRNVRLSEAPSHGVPAVVYDPNSRGAVAYHAMAKEILIAHGWVRPDPPSPTSHVDTATPQTVEGA